jgi:subtilisin family serine protease
MRRGLLVSAFFCLFVSGNLSAAQLDFKVTRHLKSHKTAPVIVSLNTDSRVTGENPVPRSGESHARVISTLQTSFETAYRKFDMDLVGFGFRAGEETVRPLWFVGAVAMEADSEQLDRLSKSPSVRKIFLDETITLPEVGRGRRHKEGAYTWGLEKIGVPSIRDHYTGEGVVAGILDTGIDATHPDLAGKVIYFKNFTPDGPRTEPSDGHGHGTHVAGTIAGGNASGTAIGVAPGARLAIGRIFDDNASTQLSWILEAMQWITDPDGNPNTVSDVPRVVSNSWGGGSDLSDDSPLYQAVAVWRELDIFPSFAAGNEGPGAATMSAPGVYPISFGVAASDSKDQIASFSSRGPGTMTIGGQEVTDLAKPDVAAPGVGVYSSLPGGKYDSWNGTSMATPHVTGAVVLLYQAFPNVTVDEMIRLLTQSAVDRGEPGYDYDFGYGRINVAAALKLGLWASN